MTFRRFVMIATLPLIGLGGFVGSSLTEPEANASAVPAIALTGALTGDHRIVVAPGLVEPASEEREIAAEVRGRLKQVLVEEGDAVLAGQLIAEVENADLSAQIDAAQATIALRGGELTRLLNGARPQERREVQAQLLEADAALAYARLEHERRRPLVDKGFASREALDQLQANLAAADARRAALYERLSLIQAPPRDEDVTIARAHLAAAEAALAETQARFAKTQVRTPIDGVVLRRYKRTGETVADLTPTPIARIGDVGHLRVRADVDETDVARVAVGQRVQVSAEAYGAERFRGRIVRVGSQLGRKTVRTDEPTEKIDSKVLETMVELEPGTRLPIGLRVDVFVGP
ncbi:MAG: efflux RND transporter periplasmic adaptor subunit [Pseudomonadota bacterium]